MNTIKELCNFLSKSKIKAGEGLECGKYPFYTSSSVQNKFLNNYEVEEDGIIMGTGGNATLHYCQGKFSVSTDCLVLRGNMNKINNKYLYYYLLGNMYILENGFKGAGLKHTSKKYIEEIVIYYLPNLEVQQKIIRGLDKAQELINKRKEQIKVCDELIKSQFIELFGDPVSNPKGWEEELLGSLGELGRGVSKHRPRNDPKLLGGEYPLIQTGDVANAGLYITEYKSTYSELGVQQSKMWKKDTLCITIAANIAKTGILGFDACFPDSVVGFSANEKTNNIFMYYWFAFFQKILEEQAPESAQKNINLKILNELKVIVPSIELQNQFAEFVQQVDKLKFDMEQSLVELENNFNALIQRVFKGDLF